METPDYYAAKALEQIPRLLGNMDRNPLSPTYGCMHRDYWLYKTSDFPDAVRQFGMHALALVWRHDFGEGGYHQNPRLLAWTRAALDFWAGIQHPDGSFDEFYPYERGWVGPTAFTTYTAIETLNLLGDRLDPATAARARDAVRRAALFICQGDKEEDHLANHHAMAYLAVFKAHRLLGDPDLADGCQRLWRGFLGYHRSEGWSREYDGIDPGYLSATVSFLGKVYQESGDPELLEVLKQSVEMCSYFVYPNGYYGGSLGSRNTLHFYPHGFEILAPEYPLAGAAAEKMLQALGEGKLVPPAVMSDRYVGYRVPEFLLASLDRAERPRDLPPLPYEREPFSRYFPEAGLWVKKEDGFFALANLAKGGVLKVFAPHPGGELWENDCGIIGRLEGGQTATSQWIDEDYQIKADDQGWEVSGRLHQVVAGKLFNLTKNIVFRLALLILGPIPAFSHFLKGRIRKALILKQPTAPVSFRRTCTVEDGRLVLRDELTLDQGARFSELRLGGEFFARYVPQSMFFQAPELELAERVLGPEELEELNRTRRLASEKVIARPAAG